MRHSSFGLLLGFALLIAGCSDEAAFRSDKPLTKAEAAKAHLDYPFPPSARLIYYLTYAGGMQDLESYLRFDVDPEELDSAVDALVSWNNTQMKGSLAYPREPLSSASLAAPRKEFLPMPWWDPSSIATGYYRGHIDGYALQIMVDQAHSRIYVYQND
jgi:hypothetical protein